MHGARRLMLGLILILSALLLAACAFSRSEKEAAPAPAAIDEAAAKPPFSAHVPFLFVDENGFLRPNDPLTADELRAALSALSAETGKAGLPEGEQTVTAESLRACLQDVLNEEQLAAFPAEGTLSRADLAVGVCRALGSGAGERLVPSEGALAPVDLPTDAPHYAELMEACVPHEPGEGSSWAEADLGTGREPGVFRLDGALFCCGEDGRLLLDAYSGPLYFDGNGRYTSGDGELDARCADILDWLRLKYPADAEDRAAMLRRAYDYAVKSFSFDEESEEEEELIPAAKAMLETEHGGEYGYAAGFTMLARALGYPAYPVARPLAGEEEDHFWTDIVIDCVPYIFDAQKDQRFRDGRFMLGYKKAERSGYRRPIDAPGDLRGQPYQDLAYTPPTERGHLDVATGENGFIYLIYLPYDYDESRQYKVIIYLYGADGNPYKILGDTNTYSHQNRYLGHYFTTPDYTDFLVQRGDCAGVIFASTNTTMASGDGSRYIALLQYVVDHYSTYAESSSLEDLIAARDSFCIAGPSSASQSLCVCLPTMPDVFGTVGLFSGISHLDKAVEGMAKKDHIRLVMGVGGLESIYPSVVKAYERFSELDNVDASLSVFDNSGHEWSAFDGTLRDLLFEFSPAEQADEG